MALSLIIEDYILDLFLIRIRLDSYLILPLFYPILLDKIYRNVNPLVETQLLTYLSNHLYLLHLNLLPYFTHNGHNGDMIQQHPLLQPILEPQLIPFLPNKLLHHTRHLLRQPPRKSLPDLLLQLTYLGLHNLPHYYIVPPPALLRPGGGRWWQQQQLVYRGSC